MTSYFVVEGRLDCDTITVTVKVGQVCEEGHGDESVESLRELLTLDELTNRVGMSVRNIRFYTTKGLVPPPIRRGRSGYYSADHVARLELVQELQAHGFTLSAIEKYVAGIPRRRHPRGHRAAPHDARAVAGRPAGRDVARRARQAHRPHAQRRGPGHARRARHRASAPSAAATRSRSPSSPSASACSTSASRPRPRSPPPTCTPSTAGRSPRSSTSSSAPWSGRSTRSPAPRPRRCARSSSGSSRCRSPAWSRRTRAAMDETRREDIEKRTRLASGPRMGTATDS